MLSEEWLSVMGPVELRAAGDEPVIGGYGAVFDKLSADLGGFVERVSKTAFNKSKADGWPGVMARWNHDDAYLLGTTHGKTLQLSTDKVGLAYEVTPPSTRTDVVELVRRNDVSKSSFAFRTPIDGDDWTVTDGGTPLRTLLSVKLVDVAPVNSPAYADSTSAMLSLAEHRGVPLKDVRELAAQRDLRKLFTRTDLSVPRPVASRVARLDGQAAARRLLDRRYDPYQDQG